MSKRTPLTPEQYEAMAKDIVEACPVFPIEYFGSRARDVRAAIDAKAADVRATSLAIIGGAHTIIAKAGGGHVQVRNAHFSAPTTSCMQVYDRDEQCVDTGNLCLFYGTSGSGKSKAIGIVEQAIIEFEERHARQGCPITVRVTGARTVRIFDAPHRCSVQTPPTRGPWTPQTAVRSPLLLFSVAFFPLYQPSPLSAEGGLLVIDHDGGCTPHALLSSSVPASRCLPPTAELHILSCVNCLRGHSVCSGISASSVWTRRTRGGRRRRAKPRRSACHTPAPLPTPSCVHG